DGIRAIAEVSEGSGGRVPVQGTGYRTVTRPHVRLWSRLGNEKTGQFPEIVRALQQWARRLKEPVVLDGEIVALDAEGEPTGFQNLQSRIHLSEVDGSAPVADRVAYIVFDLLREGARDLRDRRITERRADLERVFGRRSSPVLRISTQVRGNGRELYQEALSRGWEGLIAKHGDSVYKSGKRTPA